MAETGLQAALGPGWAEAHPDISPSPTVTAPSGVLDVTVVYLSPEEHCCQESSDEEACPEEAWGPQDTQALAPGHQALRTPGLDHASPPPGGFDPVGAWPGWVGGMTRGPLRS